MTQERKQLLLKDLCARLPYKPKVKVLSSWNDNKEVEEDIVDSVYCVMSDGYINTETIDSDISLGNIVLYLRPMSSMTEDEINEYENFITNEKDDQIRFCNELIFYNRHHFDYRGLIPMGLALEAPEDTYK